MLVSERIFNVKNGLFSRENSSRTANKCIGRLASPVDNTNGSDHHVARLSKVWRVARSHSD